MPGKTIFLTGAAGFIGSNTAEALLKQGHQIVGFDNLAPVYSVDKKLDNLEQVRKAEKKRDQFRLVQGDLRDGDAVLHALSSLTFDAIIHLGALAGVQPSIQD